MIYKTNISDFERIEILGDQKIMPGKLISLNKVSEGCYPLTLIGQIETIEDNCLTISIPQQIYAIYKNK